MGQEGFVVVHRRLPAEHHGVVGGTGYADTAHRLEHLLVGHNGEGNTHHFGGTSVLVVGLHTNLVTASLQGIEGEDAACGHAYFLSPVIDTIVVDEVNLFHLATGRHQVGRDGPCGQLGGTELLALFVEGIELRLRSHAQQVGLPGYGVATDFTQHVVAGMVGRHSHLDGHVEIDTVFKLHVIVQSHHILFAIHQGLGDGL